MHVRVSEHVADHGLAFFLAVAEHGLEGMIAKDGASRYRDGVRTKSWLKIKAKLRQTAVIGGFTESKGTRLAFGSLALGVYEGRDFVYVGNVGTGFTDKTLAELRHRLDPLVQKACPFKTTPKLNSRPYWVRPELVCEVSFTSWTGDNLLRHPVFMGLREDQEPATLRRQLAPTAT